MASVTNVSASSRLETDLEKGGSEEPYAFLAAMAAEPRHDKAITGAKRSDSLEIRKYTAIIAPNETIAKGTVTLSTVIFIGI